MPTTFCVCTRDNRWISQKLSMEKNTIGNEPYIKKATVLGSFFVLILLYELMKIKNRQVWEENENLRISACDTISVRYWKIFVLKVHLVYGFVSQNPVLQFLYE